MSTEPSSLPAAAAASSSATARSTATAARITTAGVLEQDGTIVRDQHKGGWTYVLLPGSAAALGTGKAVRVTGAVDAVPIEATLLPFGGGTHMLPLKQQVVRALCKDDGDPVRVRIAPQERSGR